MKASFDYDLRFLIAGLDQLESYLMAREIYWPLGISARVGESPYPQLTLGNLLLARQKASATGTSAVEKEQLSKAERELDRVRTRWRTAWSNKAREEFHSRLNLWRNFWSDYRDNPSQQSDRYSYEISRRVLLELLVQEALDIPQRELDLLNKLDSALRPKLESGAFIWPMELQAGFPRYPYWYLYGHLT